MKNTLVSIDNKVGTKFRNIQDIMNNPSLKSKLNNLVDEAVRAKQRIATEQETIKVLRDVAKNDLDLNPKLFNLYVASTFNNDYALRKTSLEEMIDLIDAVINILPESNSNFQNDNE
jgi:hypothetical protein